MPRSLSRHREQCERDALIRHGDDANNDSAVDDASVMIVGNARSLKSEQETALAWCCQISPARTCPRTTLLVRSHEDQGCSTTQYRFDDRLIVEHVHAKDLRCNSGIEPSIPSTAISSLRIVHRVINNNRSLYKVYSRSCPFALLFWSVPVLSQEDVVHRIACLLDASVTQRVKESLQLVVAGIWDLHTLIRPEVHVVDCSQIRGNVRTLWVMSGVEERQTDPVSENNSEAVTVAVLVNTTPPTRADDMQHTNDHPQPT
mmetsp:Transcript_5274/g.14251  ORF Transcript_5274/g.14251 Transcript_5274/m.14251 type:complete len:259 (-) Transcript_5274:361-1137(-)